MTARFLFVENQLENFGVVAMARDRAAWITIGIAGLLLGMVWMAAALWFGELNQDEGWYLYAARLVAEGKRPYVDFAGTQGPVLAYFYALADGWVQRYGVAAGRFFTAFLGLLATLSVAGMAARHAPVGRRRFAALLTFALILFTVYQAYFFTIVKTYSLAALLTGLGYLSLSAAWHATSRLSWPAGLAGVLLALAVGTRFSAGVLLPVTVFGLAWQGWRFADQRGLYTRRIVWLVAGAGVTLAVVFLPFAVAAPRALWFALVEYHAGRQAGSMFALLAYKAGFLIRMVGAYPVAVLMGIWLVTQKLFFRQEVAVNGDGFSRDDGWVGLLLWSVGMVTLVHLTAPFPYDDYQVFIYPLGAAALSLMIVRRAVDEGPLRRLSACVVLGCCMLSVASPVVQGWFMGERDRIWWPLRHEPPLGNLQRTAAVIRALPGARPGDLLLTQDSYLAVEAGMRLPQGLELGPFSYFPEWSDERAAACRVLSRAQMCALLENCPARIAAFSGYGLIIRAPEIKPLKEAEQAALWEVVSRRYALKAEIAGFGQAGTLLKIWERKAQ